MRIAPGRLPLLPGYVSYISALPVSALGTKEARAVTLRASLAFVLGFTLVFTTLGVVSSLFGSAVLRALPTVVRVAGVGIMILGLTMMSVIHIPVLLRERRVDVARLPRGSRGAFGAGVAFAAGWRPCIGPVLATILAAAAATRTVAWGALLLLLYSLGLGIPFVALALGLGRAKGSLEWLRRNGRPHRNHWRCPLRWSGHPLRDRAVGGMVPPVATNFHPLRLASGVGRDGDRSHPPRSIEVSNGSSGWTESIRESPGPEVRVCETDMNSDHDTVGQLGAMDPASPSSPTGWEKIGKRRRIVALALVVLTALIAVAIWQGLSNSTTADSTALVGRTGQPARSFSLPSLSDSSKAVTLASFRGEPLVINFWASWCIPCRTEMPLLEQAFRAEKGKVRFLGIDSNDTSSAARAFLQQVRVTYPTVSDSNATVATQYELFGLPTTVFISPSGRIVGRHIGQLNAATLREALQEAFHA